MCLGVDPREQVHACNTDYVLFGHQTQLQKMDFVGGTSNIIPSRDWIFAYIQNSSLWYTRWLYSNKWGVAPSKWRSSSSANIFIPGWFGLLRYSKKALNPEVCICSLIKKCPIARLRFSGTCLKKKIAKYQGASYGSSYDFSEFRTQHTKEKYGACNKSQSITILNLERVMCSWFFFTSFYRWSVFSWGPSSADVLQSQLLCHFSQ